MSTGPVNVIGLDTSGFDAQIAQVIADFTRLGRNMEVTAASAARFNNAGQLTNIALQSISAAGSTVITNLNNVNGAWEQTTEVVTNSVNRILREQRRLQAEQARATAAAARQGQLYEETMAFRPRLTQEARRLPSTASSVERRFFTNAQRDLERFVASGSVTAARAMRILDDLHAGTSSRLQGVEEDFRVAALRMIAQQQNIIRRARQTTERQQSTGQSTQVRGFLENLLGPINPAATAAMTASVQGSMDRLANIVQNRGVASFQRFRDLASDATRGIAQPLDQTERNVVRLVNQIQRQYNAATQAADRLTEAQQRLAQASALGSDLRSRLAPAYNRLGAQDRERVDAQINRLESLMNRTNNPLTRAGADRAITAGLTGQGAQGFTGVEAQARRAAARIRAIIRGELRDPFNISLAIGQNFNFVKSLYTGRFLAQVTQDLEQIVSAAASYQRSIALIQTITDDVKVPFEAWSDSIREVSDLLGKPIADVAAASYDVLSNQVTKYVEDTKQVITVAGEFAKVTNSTTEDSVNLLSSAINTFRLNASSAERLAAQFFTTIDLGRVKTNEMSDTIGRSAVYAKTLGASLEDLQAGIITITQTGQKADSSFTLLNNVFQKLLNPTKELQARYDALGVSTGDVFVKTYGFAGALRLLAKETEGSPAKLADYFNEIRAFGGVDALISRIDVFEDALKQLNNSTDVLDKAKSKFDDLPGQKFLVEMNKAKNAFLTTFQTNILTTIVSYTEHIGGLANAIKVATAAAVGLGTTLAVIWIPSKINTFIGGLIGARSAIAALGAAAGSIGTVATAGIAAAVVAVGALTAAAVHYYTKSIDYYDSIKARADKAAEAEVAANQKASDARIKSLTDKLKGEQSTLLRILAINKQVLQQRVAAEEAANKRIAESLKNAYENGFSTARNILDELRNKQRDLLKSANDFEKTGTADIVEKYKGEKFRRQLANLDTMGGNPAKEAELFKQRIDDLNRQAVRSAKLGERDQMRKLLDERDSLVEEAGNKYRDSVKNARQSGVEPNRRLSFAANEEYLLNSAKFRLRLEQQITAEQKRQGVGLQGKINDVADKLRELEDAQKSLAEFKLEDNGKPIDTDKEAAVKRFTAIRERVLQLQKEISDLSRPGDKLLQRDLFAKQNALAEQRASEMLDSIKRTFDAQGELQKQGELVNKTIDKLGDDAVSRLKVAEGKLVSAQTDLINSVKNARVGLDNVFSRKLLGNESFGPTDLTSATSRFFASNQAVKRAELQEDVKTAVATKQYDVAIQKIQTYIKFLQEQEKLEGRSLLGKQIPGEGGYSTTVGDELKKAQQQLQVAADAKRREEQAQQQVQSADQSYKSVQGVINQLDQSYRALGGTDQEVASALIRNQRAAAASFDQTTQSVQFLENAIRKLGQSEAEIQNVERNVRNNAYQQPGAVVAPDGTITPPQSGFNPQVRLLNPNGAQGATSGGTTQNVNVNVSLEAAPGLEAQGQQIVDIVRRELRRNPVQMGSQ